MKLRWALLIILGCGSCARTLITLSAPIADPHTGANPLEVVARASGVTDPLPMHGGHVAWIAVEESLARVIAHAAMPWAETHRNERVGGWQLAVDVWQASVRRHDHAVTVRLSVRATLRTHEGNRYLAQTQSYCQHSMLVESADAAPVFYACMNSIGHELAGWLAGISP